MSAESRSRDDASNVAWVRGFLAGTLGSLRDYSRDELLEKMREVLDVIGWPFGLPKSREAGRKSA